MSSTTIGYKTLIKIYKMIVHIQKPTAPEKLKSGE